MTCGGSARQTTRLKSNPMKNPYSRTKLTSLLAAAGLALMPAALALDPPPDGGYFNFNTAEGTDALFSVTAGSDNTAAGFSALMSNTIGNFNTAIGYETLISNATAHDNTAIGANALIGNTMGSGNTALGSSAGANLTTGGNNIDIGSPGVAGDSNKIRIGIKGTQKATFVAGISGVTVANGVGVIVNPQGQLGTVVSSARFKDSIKPMDKASEAILSLQPVTFRYKHELDPDGIPQFGLVAEQVEKVNPNLVARDEEGKPYTVRYEAVNAMLLNEFLKEHRKVESLEKAMAEQQAENAAMRTMLNEQAAQIQKVSDQLGRTPTSHARGQGPKRAPIHSSLLTCGLRSADAGPFHYLAITYEQPQNSGNVRSYPMQLILISIEM